MRKNLFWGILLFLITVFIFPAFAYADTLYANEDTVKVYKSRDTDSKVLKKLKGGEKVKVLEYGKTKKWAGVVVEGKKGEQEGWVQMKRMSYTMPSKYCKHKWSDWRELSQPSCTSPGIKERSCSRCGNVETAEIKKLGHTYGGWTVTKQATCSAAGERYRVCKVCGSIKSDTIKPLAHTYDKWTTTKKATCSEEGQKYRTCKVCGYVKTKVIEKKPHDLETKVIQEPTDHSAGIRTSVCRVCGYTSQQESFDPEGTLRRGDRSEAVKQMQQLLVDQNYLSSGGADGIFGGGTEAAVMAFQTDRGLTPDGVGWPQTVKLMQHSFKAWETKEKLTRVSPGERIRDCRDCSYEQSETVPLTPYLERGRRAQDVRAVQQMLASLGFDTGAYDGIYGPLLDAAYENFAKENGITFEQGAICPAQIDNLVNKWLENQSEQGLTSGTPDSPVNMALTITREDEDVADEPDAIITYRWTVTNLGAESTIYTALLLNFDEDNAFMADNLILNLDGITLEPFCANEVSGTVRVSSDWGEGDMHFAALAVSDTTGSKWLSNVEIIPQSEDDNTGQIAG